MLLTRDILLKRLGEHLRVAHQIDIAVAWACECEALERLRLRALKGGSLRAIVGISGNATEPSALRTIQANGKLRIVEHVERLFHPKVYLFHCNDRRIGWIGSANLTRPGFQQNEEVVFEFSDDDGSALEWFNGQWATLGNDDYCGMLLDEYEKNWKPPPPPPRVSVPSVPIIEERDFYDLAQELTDWQSFVAALVKADAYWSSVWPHAGDQPVTGERGSWLDTITRGRAVIHRDDWSNLSDDDWHLLMGLSGYGLLGSMRGAGYAKNVFNEVNRENLQIRRTVRDALQDVIDAHDGAFADKACNFIEKVNQLRGFRGAIATRFLALARPDRAVSVNRGSRTKLAGLTRLPQTTLANPPHGRARSYLDVLHWFEKQNWYSNPTPRDAFERTLADARAALIDAFVYEEP